MERKTLLPLYQPLCPQWASSSQTPAFVFSEHPACLTDAPLLPMFQVQVRGSSVHSNYCVGVEVRAQAPVSVISEGTHLFVPRTPLSTMVLRGSLSYDPDRPGATLR